MSASAVLWSWVLNCIQFILCLFWRGCWCLLGVFVMLIEFAHWDKWLATMTRFSSDVRFAGNDLIFLVAVPPDNNVQILRLSWLCQIFFWLNCWNCLVKIRKILSTFAMSHEINTPDNYHRVSKRLYWELLLPACSRLQLEIVHILKNAPSRV